MAQKKGGGGQPWQKKKKVSRHSQNTVKKMGKMWNEDKWRVP